MPSMCLSRSRSLGRTGASWPGRPEGRDLSPEAWAAPGGSAGSALVQSQPGSHLPPFLSGGCLPLPPGLGVLATRAPSGACPSHVASDRGRLSLPGRPLGGVDPTSVKWSYGVGDSGGHGIHLVPVALGQPWRWPGVGDAHDRGDTLGAPPHPVSLMAQPARRVQSGQCPGGRNARWGDGVQLSWAPRGRPSPPLPHRQQQGRSQADRASSGQSWDSPEDKPDAGQQQRPRRAAEQAEPASERHRCSPAELRSLVPRQRQRPRAVPAWSPQGAPGLSWLQGPGLGPPGERMPARKPGSCGPGPLGERGEAGGLPTGEGGTWQVTGGRRDLAGRGAGPSSRPPCSALGPGQGRVAAP